MLDNVKMQSGLLKNFRPQEIWHWNYFEIFWPIFAACIYPRGILGKLWGGRQVLEGVKLVMLPNGSREFYYCKSFVFHFVCWEKYSVANSVILLYTQLPQFYVSVKSEVGYTQ